jgi:hypothetical protein
MSRHRNVGRINVGRINDQYLVPQCRQSPFDPERILSRLAAIAARLVRRDGREAKIAITRKTTNVPILK